MEKILIKAAVYGFLIGAGLMVLLTPYETVEYIPGGFVTTQIPTRKYIITLLQNISLFTFAVLTATLIWHTWQKSWAIHIGIFLAVFILTCLLLF